MVAGSLILGIFIWIASSCFLAFLLWLVLHKVFQGCRKYDPCLYCNSCGLELLTFKTKNGFKGHLFCVKCAKSRKFKGTIQVVTQLYEPMYDGSKEDGKQTGSKSE